MAAEGRSDWGDTDSALVATNGAITRVHGEQRVTDGAEATDSSAGHRQRLLRWLLRTRVLHNARSTHGRHFRHDLVRRGASLLLRLFCSIICAIVQNCSHKCLCDGDLVSERVIAFCCSSACASLLHQIARHLATDVSATRSLYPGRAVLYARHCMLNTR